MAYNEHDNLRDSEELTAEEDALFEDPAYTHNYDTFYERRDTTESLDEEEADDLTASDLDSSQEPTPAGTSDATRLEEGFGETINPETNPHVSDQLEDERLAKEAEADYTSHGTPASDHHEGGLLDRAKDKINDWTDRNR